MFVHNYNEARHKAVLSGRDVPPGARSDKNVFNYIKVWVSLQERLDDWETCPNWCPRRNIWHNAHGIMETPSVSDLMKFWWVYGDGLPETPPKFWDSVSAIMTRDDYDEAHEAIAKEWEEQQQSTQQQCNQNRAIYAAAIKAAIEAEQDQQKSHRAEQAGAVRQVLKLADMLE
jgi:hypothetical protein